MFCVPLQEPYKGKNYGQMWYKNFFSVGIRRKFGDKKQIWSFGGRKPGKGKDSLVQLGVECLKKLDGGMEEKNVKEWVDSECKP